MADHNHHPPNLRKRDSANVLGPLTTNTWTMPPSCTVLLQEQPTEFNIYRGQQCTSTPGVPRDNTACWPPTTSGAAIPTHPFMGWGIYSPGIVCPRGYVTACTAEYGKNRRAGGWASVGMQYALEVGETAVGCCPEGYACESVFVGTCLAVVPVETGGEGAGTTTVMTGVCEGERLVSTVMATFPDEVTVTRTVTMSASGSRPLVGMTTEAVARQATLFAPMFQLYYQDSDLPPQSQTRGSGGGGGGEGGVVSESKSSEGVPTGTGLSEEGGGGGKGGLSTGTTAGIAIGAAIGGLILLGIGVCFFMRRKRRRGEVDGDRASTWASSELPAQPYRNQSHQGGGYAQPEMISPYYHSFARSPASQSQLKWGPMPVTELPAGDGPAELAVPDPGAYGDHRGHSKIVESARYG